MLHFYLFIYDFKIIILFIICLYFAGDREVVDVVPLDQDLPVPEACTPFVNVTRISENEGYFFSPGYPSNYPSNIDCFLVLEGKIHFNND